MDVQQQTLGGRYKLLDELGSGGMAVVWRARDEVLGRTVAVKVLAGRYADDPLSRARIRDEARAAATLSPHPNIAQVYDFGESAESGSPRPYVVMELVHGPTLQQRAADGPLPPRTVLRICGEVASALAAAHADGLVHRDIKPANVMVTPSGAKVVDFGIAAAAGPRRPDEVLLGTPAYLAPERVTGGAVEPASDVYALGILLYRLLANESPWSVDTTTQMLSAHVYLDPAPMPRLPGVSVQITDLVNRCLRKRPAARPSAAEAAAILADAAEPSQDAVRPDAASAVLTPAVLTPAVPAPAVPAPAVPAPAVPTPAVPAPAVPTPAVPASVDPSEAIGSRPDARAPAGLADAAPSWKALDESGRSTPGGTVLGGAAPARKAPAEPGGSTPGEDRDVASSRRPRRESGGSTPGGDRAADVPPPRKARNQSSAAAPGIRPRAWSALYLSGGAAAGIAVDQTGDVVPGIRPPAGGNRTGGANPAAPGADQAGPSSAAAAGSAAGKIPAPRRAREGRPPRQPVGPDRSGAPNARKAAAVPGMGKRKRRALLAGGGLATVAVAGLLLWLFVPTGTDRGRNDAIAPPQSAAGGPSAVVHPPLGATATAGTVPGVDPTFGGGAAPDAAQPQVPPNQVPPGAPDPGTVQVTDPGTPPASPPDRSPPAAGPPAKTLSSQGGTVVARCVSGKALLTGWRPKAQYEVYRVNAGPVLAAVIVFQKQASKIRMTVTCVAGVPATVNLPL